MEKGNTADQLAIRNLYAAYTFAVDDHDPAAFTNCFTADAEVEVLSFEAVRRLMAAGGAPFVNAKGRVVGHENLQALVMIFPQDSLVLHLTSNLWIKRIEGDDAEAQAAFCVFAEDGVVEHYGRYMDKLKRGVDGQWRFKERRDVCRYERQR